MRVPTRLPERYTRSLRGQAQAEPDETFRRGMDDFGNRDSIAIAERVYRSVPGYSPRAKAEELARAGDTVGVWSRIGVQLQRDPKASEWAHETAAVAHENAARRWRERISRGEYVAGRSTDQAVAGELEETARRIRERR